MAINPKYEDLALRLFHSGAIKFGEFRLKLHEKNPDAPLSPIYIDLRVLKSIPSLMSEVIGVYEDLIAGLEFNCYADVPTAATPIVAILSYVAPKPMITPRIGDKDHGVKGKVEGIFLAGGTALLVDDLITKADSKLEAIAVLEEHTLRVTDVVVLVDREQGGVQELAKRGYECHAAFKLSELLELYVDMGLIGRATYDKAVAYLRENA